MPTKEEVLKWYESLKQTLTNEGIDLTKPGDLLRVRSLYLKTEEDSRGVYVEQEGDIRYAFMKKKTNPETGAMSEYETARPKIDPGIQKEGYAAISRDFVRAIRERDDAQEQLKHAIDESKSLDAVKTLKEAFEQKLQAYEEAKKDKREKLDVVFAEHDKWMIGNNTVFDPETEYEQIEGLYDQAKKGLLVIDDPEKEAGHVRQILVTKDNTAIVSKDFFDAQKLEYSEISQVFFGGKEEKKQWLMSVYREALEEKLAGKSEEEQAEIRKKYQAPERMEHLPKAPVFRMEEPENPHEFSWFGIVSWLKKVFLRDNSAYQEYDAYVAAREEHNRSVDVYENEVNGVKERNAKRGETYEMMIAYVHKNDYPENVEDLGKVNTGLQIYQMLINRLDDEKDIEDFNNWDFEFERKDRDNELKYEGHENPSSFREDGTRDPEESRKYWENRKPIAPEHREAQAKWEELLREAEFKEVIREGLEAERKEIGEMREELRAAKQFIAYYKDQTGNDPAYQDKHLWVGRPVNDVMEKIGALYGKDAEFGTKIFFEAAMQNRVEHKDGTPYEGESKSNADCESDLKALMKYAYHPDKVKPGNELLERLKPAGQKEFVSEEIADSLASIAATGCGYEPADLDHVSSPAAICACLFDRVVKTAKLDTGKPLCGDHSLTNENDIEAAERLAVICENVQKGFGIAKDPLLAKKAPEVPELNIRRPMENSL